MKNCVKLLPVLFLLTSCYTTRITPEILTPSTQNNDFFEQFNIEINEQSFSEVFSPSHKIIDAEYYEDDDVDYREVHVINETKYAADCKNLIRKYAGVPDLHFHNEKPTLVFSVNFYERKSADALRFISVMTFGTLNLAGLPYNRTVQYIDLSASVYDKNGNYIKSYNGFGRDTFLGGVYYYSSNQIRPSFIKTVKKALKEIDNAMANDKKNVIALLK
ncbi:MAG TPA: hypothetical protein VKA10_08645 [Prolixibacteraceae bacterium]|nr:hypothetical protein [Prolixibacteraceae bacterium]